MKAPHNKYAEPHAHSSASKLNWLRAAVLGANDGIVSIAALVVGVAGAAASTGHIYATGVAGVLAGMLSMAAGEYVSVSSQRDTEMSLLAKEKQELLDHPEEELEELTSIYEAQGLTRATAEQVAKELTAADVFSTHVREELGMTLGNLTNPWHAAIASALSFFAGAIIPFIAIILPPASVRIPITFGAVFVALVATGIISARMSGAKASTVTLRVVAGGIFAMLVTFGIGRLFGATSL